MKTNTPCPRCGKTNPADVHTCTSKKDIEEWFKKQDQSTDSNPIGYLLWDAGLGWWEFVEEKPVEYYDYKAVYVNAPSTVALSNDPETDFGMTEPVAWIHPNHLDKAKFMPVICHVGKKQRDDFIPLYTRPERAKKPMTEEEIIRAFGYDGNGSLNSFGLGAIEGVRFAEKHHGIGGGDE